MAWLSVEIQGLFIRSDFDVGISPIIHRHIYNQFNNIKGWFLGGKTDEVIAKLKTFLDNQETWMKIETALHKYDESWQAFGLIISQYEGLIAGYQALAPPSQVRLIVFGQSIAL